MFSKLIVSFYIPNDSVWGLVSFTSLPTHDIVRLLTFSHSIGYVMIAIIALISNYLMTNDAEQYSYAYFPFVSLLQWNAYSFLAKLKKKKLGSLSYHCLRDPYIFQVQVLFRYILQIFSQSVVCFLLSIKYLLEKWSL